MKIVTPILLALLCLLFGSCSSPWLLPYAHLTPISGTYNTPITISNYEDYSFFEERHPGDVVELWYTTDGTDISPKGTSTIRVPYKEFSLTLDKPGTYEIRIIATDRGEFYMYSSISTYTYVIQ